MTESEAELRAKVERLETKIERQGETIVRLEAENERLDDENESLREHNRRITRQLADAQSRISALEDERDNSENDNRDDSGGENEPKGTPMQQLINAGEAGVLGSVTPTIRRAKTIAEHFGQWATKTPNGLVISDDLKRLVETATGENLFWKQIERACIKLAEATKGAIAFKKHDRKGWMLIAQPEDHRYRSLSASTS